MRSHGTRRSSVVIRSPAQELNTSLLPPLSKTRFSSLVVTHLLKSASMILGS